MALTNYFVYVKELKSDQTKNGGTYTVVIDGEGNRWNLFPPMPKVEVGKGYVFRFEQSGQFRNVKEIEQVANLFKQQAMKEMASKNDIGTNMRFLMAYAKDMVIAGTIARSEFQEECIRLYRFLATFTDEEYARMQTELGKFALPKEETK